MPSARASPRSGGPTAFFDAPGRHAGARLGDRRDRGLPARVERESRRRVRHEPRSDALLAQARLAAAAFLRCEPDEAFFGANMTTLNFTLTRTAAGSSARATRSSSRGSTTTATSRRGSSWRTTRPRRRLRRDPRRHDVDHDDLERKLTDRTASSRSRSRRTQSARSPSSGSSSSRTRRVRSHGPTPCTTARTGRSTLRSSASTSSSARRTSSTARTRARLRPARARSGGGRTRCGPLHDLTVRDGDAAHELLAGFVARRVHRVDRLGRDPDARARARAAVPRRPPRRRRRSTACGRWRAACRRSPSPSRTHARAVAERLGARELAVWDGDYYAVEVMERLGLGRKVPSARASSTTTPRPRSTGCSRRWRRCDRSRRAPAGADPLRHDESARERGGVRLAHRVAAR